MAHFHCRREHRPTGICCLLTEQAKQRSQQEKEGKTSFHGTDMVEGGVRSVNDYPPCRAKILRPPGPNATTS